MMVPRTPSQSGRSYLRFILVFDTAVITMGYDTGDSALGLWLAIGVVGLGDGAQSWEHFDC
jgi:hypothetical protein